MDHKLATLSILIIFSLFLFNLTNALIVYLRPPKMIIRLNTSDSVENSLYVENRNNISMAINATMDGNITQVITIKNPEFEIQPNETKTIDFVTNAKEPGVYYGQIIVTYTVDINKPVTVPAEITVVATKNSNSWNEIPIVPVVAIIIILIIAVSIIWLKRGRGR